MAFLREIRTKRKSGKVYSYWVVIKSFWDKEKRKVRHRIIHNLGTLSLDLKVKQNSRVKARLFSIVVKQRN